MAMAAVEDLELRSVDITSAFTNGDLDEEIYMKQPQGFHIGGPNKVCYRGYVNRSMAPHSQEDKYFMSKVPYLSAVGSLQYLVMMTRPYIAQSVAYLAHFDASPVRYVILTCHSYVTVYIYPRYSHLKSLASYFGLQLFSLSHKQVMGPGL